MNDTGTTSCPRTNWPAIALAAALGGACLWTFWPALRDMAGRWVNEPQYSHGYLVPVFALVLLYLRRDKLAGAKWQINWRGLPLLAAGGLAYVAAAAINFDWLAGAALLPAAAGLVVLLGGGPALRWAWPAVVFLVFMIPLPFRVEHALGDPLQRVATIGSNWALQALGFASYTEGHVIVLEHGRIAVVEACNGLSMLLTFAAITTGMAFVVRRPLLDKVVVLLSTLPIAVFVNIVRITLNGVGVEVWDPKTANELFHDQGGWLMMPMAIGLVWFELWALSRLLVEVPQREGFAPLVGFQLPPPPPRAAART
jgi:exosortase